MGQSGPFQSSWQNCNSSAEAVWSHQSFMAQSLGSLQVQALGRTDNSHNHERLRGSFINSRSSCGRTSGEANCHHLSSNFNRVSELVDHKQVEDTWGNIG